MYACMHNCMNSRPRCVWLCTHFIQGSNLGFVDAIKVVQETGQAKVRHLATQVLAHQDVPGSQVSVDVIVLTEVLHAGCYAQQHVHQRPRSQLALSLLQQNQQVSQKWEGGSP